MRITKRQLMRIIRESINESQTAGPPISGDHAIALGGSYGGPPKNPDPKGALAAAREMGYSLRNPPYLDSNNIAIDDALAAYPGEFTYEDIIAAVEAVGGLTENRSPLGTDEEIADRLIQKGKFSFKQRDAIIAGLKKLDPSYKQKMSDISSNVKVGY